MSLPDYLIILEVHNYFSYSYCHHLFYVKFTRNAQTLMNSDKCIFTWKSNLKKNSIVSLQKDSIYLSDNLSVLKDNRRWVFFYHRLVLLVVEIHINKVMLHKSCVCVLCFFYQESNPWPCTCQPGTGPLSHISSPCNAS